MMGISHPTYVPAEPTSRIRIAAIRFLNPAPLLFGFEHEPGSFHLLERYQLHYTTPAKCAEQLRTGEASLGLVPIGALPYQTNLLAVPGCTIASLQNVRSIQLVVKPGFELGKLRSVAADEASRSSAAYARILLRAFYGNDASFQQAPADLKQMLAHHDAALLIGDPALFALQARDDHGSFLDHQWIDVAELWRRHTGLPWVAAVWALREETLSSAGLTAEELTHDLQSSRDAGLANIDALVKEWAARMPLPPTIVREYLTRNIHYTLDNACLRAIDRFYELGEQTGVLPHYTLRLLPQE